MREALQDRKEMASTMNEVIDDSEQDMPAWIDDDFDLTEHVELMIANKISWPLTLISDNLNRLGKGEIFSTMDLTQASHTMAFTETVNHTQLLQLMADSMCYPSDCAMPFPFFAI